MKPLLMAITRAIAALALAQLCLFATIGAASAQPNPSADTGLTAFVGVNVIPMDSERVLHDQTVLVRGDRIVSIGPASAADVPETAQRIDGEGRWLIPGLAEMHGHVPGADDRVYRDNMLFLFVANGVTTIRNMAGDPSHLALRKSIAAGEIVGPTLYTASPWLDEGAASSPDEAAEVPAKYKAAGYDLIKIGSLPAKSYLAMAKAANRIGMPFGGHIPEGVDLETALKARQKSIDHFDRYAEFLVPMEKRPKDLSRGFFGSGWIALADEGRIPLAVELTKEAGVWNMPTMSFIENMASADDPEAMLESSEMRYMPRPVLEHWANGKRSHRNQPDFQPDAARRLVELRRKLLLALHRGGALVALGSDAPQYFNVPGFSAHREMLAMQQSGLTPYEVLVTATRNPAAYFNASEEFGTVSVGKRADLILLSANPLDDIANAQKIEGVMLRGNWIDKGTIEQRLNEIAKDAAAPRFSLSRKQAMLIPVVAVPVLAVGFFAFRRFRRD